MGETLWWKMHLLLNCQKNQLAWQKNNGELWQSRYRSRPLTPDVLPSRLVTTTTRCILELEMDTVSGFRSTLVVMPPVKENQSCYQLKDQLKDQLVLGSSQAINSAEHTWMRSIVLSLFIHKQPIPYLTVPYGLFLTVSSWQDNLTINKES